MKIILLKVKWKISIKTILSILLIVCFVSYVLQRERSSNARHVSNAENLTLTEKRTDGVTLIPPDYVLKRMSEEELIKLYWKYVNSLQILCRTQTRVGSVEDGGKEVCLDQSYLPKQPCIVYSFGSNYQFDFDLAMYNHFGCDVFTYDPSMTGLFLPFITKLLGWSVPQGINFHYVGLAGKDYVNNKQWKMKTLQTILKDNGHLDVTIDVLKIDIEGAEWDALPPFLESGLHKNVKQILLEIHVGKEKVLQLAVLRLLYKSGFRIFQREHNLYTIFKFKVPPSDEITTVNEISLINVNYYSKGN